MGQLGDHVGIISVALVTVPGVVWTQAQLSSGELYRLGDHVGSVVVVLVAVPGVVWTQAQIYHHLCRPLSHPLWHPQSPRLVRSLFPRFFPHLSRPHLSRPHLSRPHLCRPHLCLQLRLLAAQVTFREAYLYSLRRSA
jgi:hypothetical protein